MNLDYRMISSIGDLSNLSIKEAEFLFQIEDSDELSDALRVLYEWEYKYHKIKNTDMVEDRKDNMLSKIINKITPIADRVMGDIYSVFNKWVAAHDTTKPEEWAKERLEGFLEERDVDGMLGLILGEYRRYAYRDLDGTDIIQKMYESSPDIFTNNIIPSIMDEIIEDLQYNIENAESEEEADELQADLDSYESYDNSDWVNLICVSYGYSTSGVIEFLNTYVIYTQDQVELMVNLYSYELPEFWLDWWTDASSDFLETEENIQEITESLADTSQTLQNKLKVINIALNTIHNNGSMLDYVSDEYTDVDKELLNDLSNSDTSAWDADLAKGL